jgi:acyl-CoA dehydrogenase
MASQMIVVVKSSTGTDLRLVDLEDASVTVTQQKNLDTSRAFFKVEFKDTPSRLIGKSGDGWNYIQHLLDQAAVLFAFEQVGGSQAALDMAKSYSMERFAFGRQIGSYQAIKHKLADMYIAVTLAKSNCYYGAWALSQSLPNFHWPQQLLGLVPLKLFNYALRKIFKRMAVMDLHGNTTVIYFINDLRFYLFCLDPKQHGKKN